jgi:hypothetical protein
MPSTPRLCVALFAVPALALLGAATARATPEISEFMASNNSTIADQDGDYADWLELYNPDATAVDLSGWYLTNKASSLKKWTIPAVTLQPGGYLVVFCSQKNYTDPSQPLATSFDISASGGYLALVEPDGKTIASTYTFPVQYPDVSYGVSQPANASELPQIGYFERATPGAANGDHTNILLSDQVTVATPPGIFTGTANVTLSGASASEHIRYVVNQGSTLGDSVPAPTAASTEYTGPIALSSSGLVRAAVFSADDSQRGLPSTAMYIQLDSSTANRLDTFSSQLPLVLFDNNGFGVLLNDGIYHPAWFGAFSPGTGGMTTLTQAPDFFTPDTMKLHGYSSSTFPKQSYDFDLADQLGDDVDEPIFGMDSNKDWDSIAPWYFDRTYIHNAFVYSLARSMGHWAAETTNAEMFIHSAGGILDATSYAGITAITDRIKVDAQRVNIFSISPNDVTAPNVTGGYILRIDHPESDEYTWTTSTGVTVMVDTPKLDVIVQPQIDYITGFVQQMETAMVSDAAAGFATRRYLNFIDRPSWVDYHILNVFVENVDAFEFSEYFSKDVGGLIVAGPVWDYDRSMGSADGRDANPEQWSAISPSVWNIGWWGLLAQDPDFRQAWIDRWQALRANVLSTPNLIALSNSLAAQVGPAAAARDAAQWPNDQSRFGGAWSGEIANMQSWLTSRALWIDQQFLGPPSVQTTATSVSLTPVAGSQLAYTLDGTDPRLPGGQVSPSAKLSPAAVAFPPGQAFGARTYNPGLVTAFPGTPWSSPVLSVDRLVNVSCRSQVATGAGVLIDGFVVSGPTNSQEQVLVRGVGPTLAQLGLASGLLAQPSISVYDSSDNLVASNTGWSTAFNSAAIANAAAEVGAFALPSGSADSALLLNLSPGSYTLQVSGAGPSTGVALGEVYEIGSSGSSLVNLSSRGTVGTGNAALIAGIVVSGASSQTVLLRADGPALAEFGVAGSLAQPTLQLFDSKGNLVAANTGWGTNANAAQIAAAAAGIGAFALEAGSADSAVLATLPPGAYTMVITGAGSSTGVALAEAYTIP